MPYIVTTKWPKDTGMAADGLARAGYPDVADRLAQASVVSVSRRAIATLEEARDVMRGVLYDERGYRRFDDVWTWRNAISALLEDGGAVGPLPDGTLIEVAPVADDQLRAAVAYVLTGAYEKPLAEVIDAWNARQS